MNLPFRLSFLFLIIITSVSATAQDTLPKFSLRNAGNNRIIIGWVNPFPNVSQISIQRSFDSLKNFKTILTVADPRAIQNGFADTKAPNDKMFYRIFYVIQGGSFFFTASKKADSLISNNMVRANGPVIPGQEFQGKNDTLTGIRPPRKPEFTPSFYVYTNKDGYVFINLPDADEKKYSLKIFEEDETPLFEIKSIKDKALTLDKANFYHAGWYLFELYNGEKLVEKSKFFVPKSF
jgi:hypothetical protein